MGRPGSPPGGPGVVPPGRYSGPPRRTRRVRAWGGRGRLRGVRGVVPPGRYSGPPRRTRRVRAWGGRGRLRGVRGVVPPGRYSEPPRRTRRVRAWGDAGWLRGQTTRRRIHRRSDGGPERRQRCSDGGPEHRYECYTETPRYVSRPNYACILGEVRSRAAMSRLGRALTVCGRVANALMSGSRASLTRRNASFWQVWPILHESTNVVRLTSPVGENDRNVRDENRENGRYSGEPPEVVDEQEDRDTKADGAEGHHDEVPALPVSDVLGHRAAGLRDQRNVSVGVTPCDPHLSKVSPPRANTHPGPQRPLRSERSPRRLMPEGARRPVPVRLRSGPGPLRSPSLAGATDWRRPCPSVLAGLADRG